MQEKIKRIFYILFSSFFLLGCLPQNKTPIGQITSIRQIKRIWLTHRTNEPSHIVINWYSESPGFSEVLYRSNNDKYFKRIKIDEEKALHHVEIPLQKKSTLYYYKVITGMEESEIYTFKNYPSGSQELRVAIVGNWGSAENTDFSQLIKDNPHLLLTVGDNISNLHEFCGEGFCDCIEAYLKLIDSAQDLFRTIPFMPILGNHDKECRKRGEKYPPLPVYDIDAKAFCTFFELPDDEWKWHFTFPNYKIGFVALDLNHTSDIGTTWQSCHDFNFGSEQMDWYKSIMNSYEYKLITLHNERNQTMRKQENGEWQRLFEKGLAVISGFGYYSEKADVEGFPYLNTSLKNGDQYPDEFSKFLKARGGYILMKIKKGKIVFEMKSLDGVIMHQFDMSI